MRSAELFIAIVVAVAAPAGAQPPEILFDNYLEAVRAYQHGTFDSRSSSIAELSKADFSKIRSFLTKQEPRAIQAAALVHTEIALTATDNARVDLQLAMAEAALRLLPKDVVPGPSFTANWYRVVPTIYLARRDPEPARPFIERALRASPDDPRLHLLSGIAHETTAQLHAINCVDQGCLTRQRRLDLLKWTGFAAAEYRRTLQLDPRLAEAQLRLGRVMTMSGDAREARSVLNEASLNASDMSGRYLATLFLASIATDSGGLPTARSLYEDATRLCSSCQAASVGRGFIEAMIGGNAAGSIVERFFENETAAASDPWIVYQFPPLDSTTLDALRAEVRQ
jgi:tetratricopeptide (TPR) repeat protein